MSREEDKRLYEQKKCLFMGEIINTSFGCDEDFITSKLTACRTSTELESIENALFDTARTLDGIATERKAEGEPESTTFSDILAETVDKVKTERLTSDKGGVLRWFVPCVDVVDVAELQDKTLPPMKWLIDDLLPVGGVVMLSAKPKMGKSFLAMQLALTVASGGKFLGFQAEEKHEVLYIDLETSQRSMKDRISMMTADAPRGLYLMTPEEVFEFGNIGNGFESQVDYFLESHKGVKLVIVDTYGLIQGSRTAAQNIYRQEYAEISHLNSWARKKGFTLVLIHHQNKQDDYANPVQGISGSTGITGGLQAYYILSKRDYTDTRTKLTIGGKEIAERDIFIQPESDNNRTWVEVEPEDRPSRRKTVSNDPITMTIRDLCADIDEIEITSKELAERVGKSPRSVGLWLNQYEGELAEYQGIAFMKKHTKGGTIYTIRME